MLKRVGLPRLGRDDYGLVLGLSRRGHIKTPDARRHELDWFDTCATPQDISRQPVIHMKSGMNTLERLSSYRVCIQRAPGLNILGAISLFDISIFLLIIRLLTQ